MLNKIDLSNPYKQSLLVLVFILLMIVSGEILNATGLIIFESSFPWLVSTSMIFFFSISCSLTAFLAEDIDKHLGKCIAAYAGTSLIAGIIAFLFATENSTHISTYKTIFIVVTFGFLTFLAIIGAIRRVVDFAQKEVWEKPTRKPPKKRR